MAKKKEDYNKHSDANYWDAYNKKFNALLKNAAVGSAIQKKANERFKPNEKKQEQASGFEKSLTDSSRYKRYGKWITHDHHNLWKMYKNGEKACPVIAISLAAVKRRVYASALYSTQGQTRKAFKLNLMPYQEAYEIFTTKYLLGAFFNQDKEFEFDSLNMDVIKDLVAYFIRYDSSELNLKKGICLYGGVGTGKSTILKQLSRFTKDMNLPTMFDFVDMDEVYTGCSVDGLPFLDNFKFRACGFDDIGMRAGNDVNSYGTKINAYQELVRSQYRRFSRPTPSLSHYTTNIVYNTTSSDNVKALSKSFGVRELDRFREMCNFVPLRGKSRRGY